MDVRIENHGSLYIFRPLTTAASDWIAENVDPNAQWWAGGLVVEPRYAQNLAEGMDAAGLSLGPGAES